MVAETVSVPLAARLRPQQLADIVGQRHLLADGKPIAAMLRQQRLHSCILWGPPGTGKTTLAGLMAIAVQAEILTLSAVSAGVKDIRSAIAVAQQRRSQGNNTLLFVDEIHRFNAAQQDALLPDVEQGTITLVGATTENPSFAVNKALLSRMRIYRLQALDASELEQIVSRALASYPAPAPMLSEPAKNALIQLAQGDTRRLLTTLEIAIDMAAGQEIALQHVREAAGEHSHAMDKMGDEWYALLSAFHKSVRGSDVDAALYWYARWMLASSDPAPIARRLLAIASEDIGNADPRALQLCVAAWDCYHRVGPTEGERAIAQAVIFCALAPKSNAVYLAWEKAQHFAEEQGHQPVPPHLRNASTAYQRELGYGKAYRYAHNEPHAIAAGQAYFPESVTATRFYQPSDRGLEKQLAERLRFIDALNNRLGDEPR